jgi:hypothetical protein
LRYTWYVEINASRSTAMASPLLPKTTTLRHAAILAGRSIRSFTAGVFPSVATADGLAVDTDKLERVLGFEISPAAWMAADRRLDHRRANQAAHARGTAA